MAPFKCCKENEKVIRNYATSLNQLVSTFRWLTDAYVVEFFLKDHWRSLPSSWQDSLGDLDLDQIADYLSGKKTSRYTSVWPLSLLAFCVATQSLALDRHPDSNLPHAPDELDHCFKYHVKDKKRHEIKTLASIINEASVESNVCRVVDVGGGQGHLTRLLSVGYGLKVMSIEAAGCHVSGATKVDRKVEVLLQRREKKGLLEVPIPNLTPQTPVHIVCTISPDISVKEFIEMVNHNLNHKEVPSGEREEPLSVDCIHSSNAARQKDKMRHGQAHSRNDECDHLITKEEDGATPILPVSSTPPHRCENGDTPPDASGRVTSLENKGTGTVCQKNDSLQVFQSQSPHVRSHSDSMVQHGECKDFVGANRRQAACLGASNAYQVHWTDQGHKTTSFPSHCPSRREEQQETESGFDNLTEHGGLDSDKFNTKVKESNQMFSSVGGETHRLTRASEGNEETFSSSDNPNSHAKPANPCVENTKQQSQEEHIRKGDDRSLSEYSHSDENVSSNGTDGGGSPEPFSLVGLHTCGDLGPTILRVFLKCPEAKVLALVGCCYMKMECIQPIKELDERETERATCGRGFPMSRWLSNLGGTEMTFEPLELACHFFDSYYKRLKGNDPSLILQAFRAMMEILIQQQRPDLVRKHAGIRQIKKATAWVKKKPLTTFESYVESAFTKLGLTFDPVSTRQVEEKHRPYWRRLIIFHALRQCLAPIIESLVLIDRMIFLLENGIESQLAAVFDPHLSPRNFVLQASK